MIQREKQHTEPDQRGGVWFWNDNNRKILLGDAGAVLEVHIGNAVACEHIAVRQTQVEHNRILNERVKRLRRY